MNVQEEQDVFKKWVEKEFISLFDLIQKIMNEQDISINESGLYLLTRINHYLQKENTKNFAFKLVDPPYLKYSLDAYDICSVKEMLNFIINNGRFRSDNNAKKCGLHIEVLKEILNSIQWINEEQQKEIEQQEQPKYNPSERTTHLQMIAILAEELAKAKSGKYLKANGFPNNLQLSELLGVLAKEIEIEALTARTPETYRNRLTEISQFYKGV